MRLLLFLMAGLSATPALAAKSPLTRDTGPELVEIRVPADQVEACQATLALVMLRPEGSVEPIVVETDTGPAIFRCVPE